MPDHLGVGTSRVPGSEIPLDIHENARDAGCYEFLQEFFFVDENDPDPSLVRQIREEADPRYVPLRCRRVYRSPANTEIVRTYHVIGKYIPNPQDGYEHSYLELQRVPSNFPFPKDKIQALRTLWAPWPKGTTEYMNSTPPAEVEFGPWVVQQMRALRKAFDAPVAIVEGTDGVSHVKQVATTRDVLFEILNEQQEIDNRMMEAAREEARYRVRHNWPQLKKAADEGRWTPDPPEAAPFVDLGKK